MNIRKEKAQLTKEKIINAAEVLLNNKSFDEISVDDIVKYANVAKGTFYIYFKKKEHVIYEKGFIAFKELAEKVQNMQNEPVEERVYAYFQGSIILIENFGINICREWIKDVINPKEMDKLEYIEETKWHFDINVFKVILQDAVKNGELSKEIPIDMTAYLIISMIYGMMTCWCISDKDFDLSKWIDKFFNLNILPILKQYKN